MNLFGRINIEADHRPPLIFAATGAQAMGLFGCSAFSAGGHARGAEGIV